MKHKFLQKDFTFLQPYKVCYKLIFLYLFSKKNTPIGEDRGAVAFMPTGNIIISSRQKSSSKLKQQPF